MRTLTLACLAFTVLLLSCTSKEVENISWLEPSEIDNRVDGVIYEVGNWEELSYGQALQSLGNHRAVITTPEGTEYVNLHLPWRRRDDDPQSKRIIIVNPETMDTVRNMAITEITPESVGLIFESTGAETYHAYYYPFKTTGGYYPTVSYLEQVETADPEWTENLSTDEDAPTSMPEATVVSIQSINEFHSFFPMEVAATQAEVNSFLGAHPKRYYLFPEFRDYPIRMTQKLPQHWMKRGWKNGIEDQAKRGEYYAFQIGVYSPELDLNGLALTYSDLIAGGSKKIAESQIECINIDGTDLYGKNFTKEVDVAKGKIQALWVGVMIPEDTQAGTYKGKVIVTPQGMDPDTVHLKLNVVDEIIENHGDNDPAKMSRLRWFNSTLGSEEDFIISPFTPVQIRNKSLQILGREVKLDETGLPERIESYFTEMVTELKEESESIISQPIRFRITGNKWQTSDFQVLQTSPGKAEWVTTNTSANFRMRVHGILEYDGMLNYELQVITLNDTKVDNMTLEVPYSAGAARYMLGLGFKGGQRPRELNWKWDVTNHHEGVWLGNVNKGMQYVLRDENYERPLNTNFYQNQPLKLPPSWYNEGKGGLRISEQGATVMAENYSGPWIVKQGDTLNFHIRFLITPFKTIDTKTHFNTRFVHKYVPVDTVKEYGGTVVNVHHANEINPYINYPFYHLDQQKAYIEEAHEKGVKVKLYNTIRELTYKSYELFPMRSLGFEIFNDGEGGGHPWLQEHLENDYHKAWHAWRVNDAAILNKGTSRWTNYYIEGLNWLAQNQEIDGLYLDDIAFSRETVKRMVAVLNRHREDVIIDLHSANQYNERDGFINSAFLYMEHFPYISRLWFGEYFEYDLGPDYWLTEVSGIPFGLTGEMLQDGGHPYRGMVYGMTTRVYHKYNPQAIWKLFDDFGIMDAEMIGYWVEDVPVSSGNPNIPVTVYKKDEAVLLALGSWSNRDERINLDIDWDQLPFDGPESTEWEVPEIEGLQEGRMLEAGAPIRVEADQGLILTIQ